jgi:hypothetical protein
VISVNYGRPSRRGRTIMGDLVPWDKVWRTGANQATALRTSCDITLGGVPVPRGTYTLWTLPSRKGWKIILNKQTGQWGTRYDERQDLARFDAQAEPMAAPVDTFTILLEKTGAASGRLVLAWETTRIWAPLEKSDRIRPLSPLDSTRASVGGKAVQIVYSKPFARGRRIWGVVVPYDSVWRTGANAATTLRTNGEIAIGDLALTPGTYVLRTVPAPESLTLIVSRQPAGQGPISDSLTVGKVSLQAARPERPIDPFRIALSQKGTDAAVLSIGWADREYSAEIRAR